MHILHYPLRVYYLSQGSQRQKITMELKMKKKIIIVLLSGIAMGVLAVSPGRFNDNGNGTVTDSQTKLVWQKCSMGQDAKSCARNAGKLNWKTAGTFCKNLNLAGRKWRLPSKVELANIQDEGKTPNIDPTAFPRTRSSWYWTSTTEADAPDIAMAVDFVHGTVFPYKRKANLYTRCVSSGGGSGTPGAAGTSGTSVTLKRFSDNGNGMVTDSQSKLIWQKCSMGQDSASCGGTATATNWKDAGIYCKNLNLAGRKWRLPAKDELVGMMDLGKTPNLDQSAFPGTVRHWYWSSTTNTVACAQRDGPPVNAYVVNFTDGKMILVDMSWTNYYVRCVSGP